MQYLKLIITDLNQLDNFYSAHPFPGNFLRYILYSYYKSFLT